MFHLSLIQDHIKILPKNLGRHTKSVIIDEILGKYANKVIENVGLCVSVFDILDLWDPFIHPGEASPFVKTTFRLVVFRPFIGEVIVGRIRYSDEHGIYITLGFFDDIFISFVYFQPNSKFDPKERLWYWDYQSNYLYMEKGEPIRFKVISEQFTDIPPVQKDQLLVKKSAAEVGDMEVLKVPFSGQQKSSPYTIIGSIAEDGLGLLSWWTEV